MALFKRIQQRDRDFWGKKFPDHDPYLRRLERSDEELILTLSNKIKIHEYNLNSRRMVIVDFLAKWLRPLLSREQQQDIRVPAGQTDNKIVLTGLELQHLHRLCDFEVPDEIHLQDDYTVELQILEALLQKARDGSSRS